MNELCPKCEFGYLHQTLKKSVNKDVGIYKFIYKTWQNKCNKCWFVKYNVTSERDMSGHKKHHELCIPKCIIHKIKNCICWCHETRGKL